jgi:hypothetical protein
MNSQARQEKNMLKHVGIVRCAGGSLPTGEEIHRLEGHNMFLDINKIIGILIGTSCEGVYRCPKLISYN